MNTYKYNNIVKEIMKLQITTVCNKIVTMKYSVLFTWIILLYEFLFIIHDESIRGNAPNGFKNII